jgi:O-antigen ligase
MAASASAFMAGTIFLSGSRGGMAAFVVQMALFFGFLFRERTRNRVLLLLGGFLLIALASITWIGGNEVSARISTVATREHSELETDIRLAIDRDSLSMVAKRPILGWGLGTFADIYPQFRSFYTNSAVNQAHNDYLQVLVETGGVGFGIVIWFLAMVFPPAIRKARNWPFDINGLVSLASLLGITGILVHSFVDFNLEVPANAMLFYVLCSVAAMGTHFRNFHREHKGRATDPGHLSFEQPTPSQQLTSVRGV